MSFKLSDDRYEEIKAAAINMFEDYDVKCLPISGFEIAAKMGMKVVPYSAYPNQRTQELMLKESEDGFVGENNGVVYIFYNDSKSYGRINNTLLHEIGHIVLGHKEDSQLAEAEVKFFAKYALVPPVLLHKTGIVDVWKIADVFDVSIQAAQYAYSYYKKWLKYSGDSYTWYEKKTLDLFKDVI